MENDKERDGEWVITYTPPGGGIGHSRALSWHAPDVCFDREKLKEAREKSKEVIESQLNNPEHTHYVHRWDEFPDFGLAWIEKYKIQ